MTEQYSSNYHNALMSQPQLSLLSFHCTNWWYFYFRFNSCTSLSSSSTGICHVADLVHPVYCLRPKMADKSVAALFGTRQRLARPDGRPTSLLLGLT